MMRAVDHAFADERIACRAERGDFAAKMFGNVAGSMRSWSEFGHREQVTFLQRGEPVESHSKETRVEICQRESRSIADILEADGRFRGDSPCVFAPLLQKIRIARGLLQNLIKRIGGVRNPFSACWCSKRTSRRRLVQGADFREFEQPLGPVRR